jgi:hypothetical protein
MHFLPEAIRAERRRRLAAVCLLARHSLRTPERTAKIQRPIFKRKESPTSKIQISASWILRSSENLTCLHHLSEFRTRRHMPENCALVRALMPRETVSVARFRRSRTAGIRPFAFIRCHAVALTFPRQITRRTRPRAGTRALDVEFEIQTKASRSQLSTRTVTTFRENKDIRVLGAQQLPRVG